MLFCSWGTAERLTAELSAVRDQLCQKEQELRVTTEKLKEKEEMLRALGGEGGATPEFLLELHQQNALTLSFATMKLCNGHTDQTTAKKVTPTSKLYRELDVNMSGMDGDVELNFSSLVDEGTRTGTMRTGPGAT
jgi:hypothetical protein